MVKKKETNIEKKKSEVIHQTEDKILKRLFSNQIIVKEFVRDFIKEDFVKDLNLDNMKLLPNDFITEELKSYSSDCLWELNYKKKKLYLIILIEFQSTVHNFMQLRFLNYITQIYLKLLKQNKRMKILPFILPVLFYTGEKEWKKSNKFHDLIDISYESVKKYIPDFEYLNFNVSKQNLNDLKEMDSILSQLLAIDLEENIEQYNTFLQKIRTISETLLKKEQKEILFKEISYYLQHKAENCLDVEEIEEILNGGKTMIAKGLKKVIERSKQEGFEQGIEKGFEKGAYLEKINTAKELLLIGTDVRFIAKITKLSIDEIEKIKSEMNL